MEGVAASRRRFIRTEMLIGADRLECLRQARVVVVGMGAVGSFAVEALARSGVGYLRLVDFDVVNASNVNRQLYALESTIGRRKVDVARERVLDINPGCEAVARPVFVDETSVADVLEPPVTVVIDAIDSLSSKVGLLVECARAGVPVVSAMGAARKVDPFAIRTGDVFASNTCPLARFVRRRLRRRGVDGKILCVFSTEPPLAHSPAAASVVQAGDERSLERGRPREPLGSVAFLTGMFGLLVAREAMSVILAASGLLLDRAPAESF